MLGDLAVFDAEEMDLRDVVFLAGGGHAHELAGMTTVEMRRTATLSPSAITSSIVMRASSSPAATRR